MIVTHQVPPIAFAFFQCSQVTLISEELSTGWCGQLFAAIGPSSGLSKMSWGSSKITFFPVYCRVGADRGYRERDKERGDRKERFSSFHFMFLN